MIKHSYKKLSRCLIKSELTGMQNNYKLQQIITVPLKEDEQVLEKLDSVWAKAASLIYSNFFYNADLADSKTTNFWIQLAQTTSTWNNSLLVP
ncbi:uncharacterized protein RCC_07514 [Ramularia collo-cygni]|uniref:Uncharacterized protein n=1 Tax=Ramularia collo-cygni TaxID=112498 RepID=A0A2D3VI39_9PEZI|nr:uncharacterized protein RCC_07514 [Ramularia collo-cygni]CZT21649.1 uncharacterized protein RCC_07514 [Ramularia collo-cygni]